MKNHLAKIDDAINPLRMIADTIGAPLFDLSARAYLAWVFWKSGMTRWNDFVNGTFDTQIFLFELEHPVPGLDPSTAAHTALFGEIVLPILLILGLFGRFAAAGLLIMTAIIEFTYLQSTTHIFWAFLAGTILIRGPGLLSVDHFLVKWIRGQ